MLGKRKVRKNVFELVFGYGFNEDKDYCEYYNDVYDIFDCEDDEEESTKKEFVGICENISSIDEIISKYLHEWKIERLSRATLSILRVSVYEMKFLSLAPAISINEAVEFAKQYCEDGAPAYVNGVLNKIAKSELKNE